MAKASISGGQRNRAGVAEQRKDQNMHETDEHRPKRRSAWPRCHAWSACHGQGSTSWSGRPSPGRFMTLPLADPSTTNSCRGSASTSGGGIAGSTAGRCSFTPGDRCHGTAGAEAEEGRCRRRRQARRPDRRVEGPWGRRVTAAQVAEAVKELYPNGASDVPQGEVLRAVFLRLRRRNSGDNVRR